MMKTKYRAGRSCSLAFAALTLCAAAGFTCSLQAQAASAAPKTGNRPWMNIAMTPDHRADALIKVLSLDEKIQLLHGTGDPHIGPPDPHAGDGNGGSGYIPGFPDKGIPGLQFVDSAYGVSYSAGSGRYSTAFPCNLASAASWDPEIAEQYGMAIGQELRDLGYNMSLGGGVNLTREPRDGRTFEYLGEDPLLAGTMVGHLIRGVQSAHVLGDIKHYAVNDQESGRHAVSSDISERAMRESDLLAFQIGIDLGHPAAVMCAYNRVNGTYACENEFLLTTVLRDDWHYPGFVMSDWLATHSTVKASHAGLDNEEPTNVFFGPAFKEAVEKGAISPAELDLHDHRILRSMFASGIVDDPPQKGVPDVPGHLKLARAIEAKSIVLLKNEAHVLPLEDTKPLHILVVGRNADKGMISGAGSAQVDPPGGNAIGNIPAADRKLDWQKAVWFPDAPVAALRAAAPQATIDFQSGENLQQAVAAARTADVVLVYAYQWQAEGMDLPSLSLPDGQDKLIAAVAAVNPRTVVVLETGGPVTMPWIGNVAGVVETWFSGMAGADAIADVLFDRVNPSGKLPLTFPLADVDLPHPVIPQPPPASQEDWKDEDAMSRKLLVGLPSFPTEYDEGLQVGYKWYDEQHKAVLFPFGFGLSYTSFAYGSPKSTIDPEAVHLTFSLSNTGSRAGVEIAQVYASLPAATGEPPLRLVGWARVSLGSGEQHTVEIVIPKERLQIWDESRHVWMIAPGDYTFHIGTNSRSLPLTAVIPVTSQTFH